MEPKSTHINMPVAQAVIMIGQVSRGEREMMSVKDEMDAAKALGDPDNLHCCPLCNDVLPTAPFVAHVKDCIRARMPRRQVWVNAPGALAVFPDKTNYLERPNA